MKSLCLPSPKSILFLVCSLFILGGCDNNDASDEESDIVGQYNMTMMDGGSVPDIFIDSAGNELILAGGELVIRDDGDYFLEISVVVNDVDESVNVSGPYSLSGSTVTLSGEFAGRYDGENVVDLTYPISGIQHLFTFDKSSVFDN